MKFGSWYQIVDKVTGHPLSYMGETRFYSMDKAQEVMDHIEQKEIEEFQNMKRYLETSFLFGGNIEFENRIIENYENRIQKKDVCIIERKGFLFGTEDK
tara:strand:+ start:126 stop:422 length:297 start_codon:yes stop_codon:yes gene_type:complete